MSKSRTIFLVHSYDGIRRGLERLLKEKGYTVKIVVGTYREALENIERAKQGGVDVAIIDESHIITLNNCIEIAEKLREAIAGIRIICFSSFLKGDWADDYVLQSNSRGLLKAIQKTKREVMKK